MEEGLDHKHLGETTSKYLSNNKKPSYKQISKPKKDNSWEALETKS